MLDTGSTVSVISDKMWRKSGTIRGDLRPVCGSLTTANASAITILGETDMPIRIGVSDVNFPMIVAHNISHDCLIGTDFFRKYCCNIKYDTGTFTIQGSEVPIRYEKQPPTVCKITIQSTTTVPPGTEVTTEGKLVSGYERNYGSPGIIEEARGIRKKKSICVARTLVVPKDGTALIRLANFTDREINLQESETVGQIYPLNHTQAMVHSLACEESDGEAPQQEIGDLPTKRTSSISSEWLKEFNIEKSELTRDQELRFLATVREYEDVFAKNESDLG